MDSYACTCALSPSPAIVCVYVQKVKEEKKRRNVYGGEGRKRESSR